MHDGLLLQQIAIGIIPLTAELSNTERKLDQRIFSPSSPDR
jgi:hypothetical protein